MNTAMYENPVVQRNIDTLKADGFTVITPDSGVLACKDVGAGKLPPESVLLDYLYREIALKKDMTGKRVLITAGPTHESMDPVRYLTNHSSGKMGYALAKNAMLRGAQVTLVSGPTSLKPLPFIHQVPVVSAKDMYEAVTHHAPDQDIIIKAAAVADYTPVVCADDKIKKKDDDLSIPLMRTQDILKSLGENRRAHQYLCGFSMETRDLIENSRAKLAKKNADMIVANNVKVSGAGFSGDTNVVTLITADSVEELPILSKDDVASRIFDAILYQMH